jgi:hypothetical protein
LLAIISPCDLNLCLFFVCPFQDLSRLNRDLSRVLVLDNNNTKASSHVDNLLPIAKFEGNQDDDQLFRLLPFIEHLAKDDVTDVREVLRAYRGSDIPQKFYEHHQKLKKSSPAAADKKVTVGYFGAKSAKTPAK